MPEPSLPSSLLSRTFHSCRPSAQADHRNHSIDRISKLPAVFWISPKVKTLWLAILFVAVNNPPTIQVVRAQFNRHPVSREDTNKILPHPARYVRQHLMPVFELHPEHRIRQGLRNRCHYLNCIFLRQSLSCSRRTSSGSLVVLCTCTD
jgi:hypothetical protein